MPCRFNNRSKIMDGNNISSFFCIDRPAMGKMDNIKRTEKSFKGDAALLESAHYFSGKSTAGKCKVLRDRNFTRKFSAIFCMRRKEKIIENIGIIPVNVG